MFKKKQFKSLLCMLMTFLIIFTSVDSGIIGMKTAFAEATKEEKALPKTNMIKVKLRVEGPEYTILPETEVEVEKGSTNADALKVAGLEVEDSGMIDSIEGVSGESFWSINPYGTEITTESSIVFNGNGAMGTTILKGPSAANAGESFEVTFKNQDGKAIKDGEVKYYKASEYDYKSINKGKVNLVTTGVQTDENGKASIKLEAGKYFVTAEGKQKSRAKAFEVEVKEKDINAPVIKIDGIKDKEIFNNEWVSFHVEVIDNDTKDIIPTVKLEENIIEPNKNKAFRVKLQEGNNKITITAQDKNNNKSEVILEVQYVPQIKIIVRVEGTNSTILPEKEVKINKGATEKDILEAAGITITEESGEIKTVQGEAGNPKWLVIPSKNFSTKDGQEVVFTSNNADKVMFVQSPSSAKNGKEFIVTVIDENKNAVKDAEIKYYSDKEYNYKDININKVVLKNTGIKTDEKGQGKIKFDEESKYFITAEKDGLVRGKAAIVHVQDIPEKLNIILPKETIDSYPCEIRVTDGTGNPVKNADIAYNNSEHALISNFEKSIEGKTDDSGKTIIKVSNNNETIYFQARKGEVKSDIQTLTLLKQMYRIYIKSQKLLLCEGEKYLFKTTVEDENYNEIKEEIKWESLNSEIAVVNEKGEVTAIKEGETVIRAILNKDNRYYSENRIKIVKDVIKAHLRVELEDKRDWSKEIRISGTEASLVDVLKNPRIVDKYGREEKYEPKFNEEGKLVELDNWQKGNPYFSVIINGKVIENPKAAVIKTGDNIVCSYNGATNQLQVEIPNECTAARAIDVIVKDENGKLVDGANIIAGYINWQDSIKKVTKAKTNKDGKGSITLNEEKEYYIFAEKDGYIRAVAKPIKVILPKVEGNFPKEVKNDEDFQITVTDEGKPVSDLKLYWAFKDRPSNKKEIGKTDENGKVIGKIDAPKGQYTLFVDFYGNTVELGNINVLDTSMYKVSKVGSIDDVFFKSSAIYAKDKIYLFGGIDRKGWNEVDSILCFDTKNNELKNIGKLPNSFCGNSAVIDDKIYLFSNEKVYEYDIEKNETIEVAVLPKDYKLKSNGTVVLNKKVYIYERKDSNGAIVEFDPNTKNVEIVGNIDLKGGNEWGGPTDNSIIVQANQKMYIIGGSYSKTVYEFNPMNKQIIVNTKLDCTIDNGTAVSINGKIYIFGEEIDESINNLFYSGSYHIVEFDSTNKTLKNVGYLPTPMSSSAVAVSENRVYIFGQDYRMKDSGDTDICKDILKVTGFQLEDTQKPEIAVEGIKDNIVVSTKEVAFAVNVTDNIDENIIPKVKCKDKVVAEKDGKYNVVLDEGKNIIEITATDKAGNTEIKKYTVIYSSNIVVNKMVIEGSKEKLHPKDKITLKAKALDKENNVISGKEFIFSSSDENIAKVNEKTGEVTAIGNGTVVLTTTLKDNKSVKETVNLTVTDKYEVYMRIEGYDHTVLPRTKLEVGLFDLSKYLGKASGSSATGSNGWDISKFEKPTNAHAIVKALIDAGFRQKEDKEQDGTKLFDLQDYGWSLYIAMIDGDREHNHGGVSGWMYRVNDVLPNVGCNGTSLNDGDEIVWYYGVYGFDNIYTKIVADETNVAVKDKVKVHLDGFSGGYATKRDPLSGANILVNGNHYTIDGKELVTDSKGNADLVFEKPGDYIISANRLDNKGIVDIVRPNPVVIHVTDQNDTQKPHITVNGIMNGEIVNQSEITFRVEAEDAQDGHLTPIVKCNDEVLIGKDDNYKAVLKEGKNNIFIQVKDKDNNTVEKTIEIICDTKDRNMPEIKVEGIISGTTDKQEVIFTVEANDKKDGKVTPIVKVNDKEILPQEGKYKDLLQEGPNTVTVEAVNKLGNRACETYKVIYRKNELILKDRVDESIKKVHNYILENNTWSSDWKTVALNKSGLKFDENYNTDYLNERNKSLKDSEGYFYKVTDYERIALGVVAAGGDPTNVGGYNLLDKIYNFKDKEKPERKIDFQGINGVIYGLIALDSKSYEIPKDAKYTREYMLDYILNNRNSDGGWDLNINGKNSDVDITAMTLISLAPYHNYVSKDGKKVATAIEEAINWLSKVQRRDGGFNSWFTENNSESCAQTIIGLCANGVDPTSTKFTKDRNLVENLLRFQQENGEFYHIMDGKSGVNGMSTEQAYQALVAYKLFIDKGSKDCDGKNSIYYFGKDNIKTDDDKKVNVEEIKLDKSSFELKEGETSKLTAMITPENASNKNVTWKCSDEKVAVVDKTGIVTAKSEGNAVIEVTTEDGDKKAQCNIKVVKKDTTTGGTTGGGGTTNPNTNNKEVTVYIRVEGYDHTIVPRTSVTTAVFDLNPYLGKATGSSATKSTGWGTNKFTSPTHAHALVKLLEDNGFHSGSGYDLQDYGWGLYIAMIDGDREFDQGPMSGWMYSVNGELPPIGLNGKALKDGDEVIWFYGAEGFSTLVTTLKADKTSIKTGEKVSVKLNGFITDGANGAGKVDHYTKKQLPTEKATILVNGKEYEVDGKIVKTDSNGQACLQFNKPGKYEISAIRYSDSNGNKIDIVRPLPININVTGETINSNGSTGSTTGSSGGGSVGGSNTQLVVLASQQMSNATIKNDELKIEIKGDREIVSVPESAILSKVDEVKKIIKDVLEKAKGDKEQLKKEIALIPIKIDDQKDNTILKIEASTLNKIKGENLGIKASFNGLEIKLPYNALPNLKGDEIIEIRKAEIKNMVQENMQMLKNNKVVSKTYSLTLYKVFKDGKEEKIKDLNDNAYVTIKIAPDQIKNISKTSLKINWYDKTNNKWVVLDSIYIPEQNIVVGKIK